MKRYTTKSADTDPEEGEEMINEVEEEETKIQVSAIVLKGVNK